MAFGLVVSIERIVASIEEVHVWLAVLEDKVAIMVVETIGSTTYSILYLSVLETTFLHDDKS